MGTLVAALEAKLGPGIQCGAQVAGIARRPRAPDDGWEVTIRDHTRERTVLASELILATPANVAGKLLRNLNPRLDSELRSIEYAPVAVVSLGYRRPDVGHSLDGFGFLVPRSAGLRVLGTVWNSSLFSGRAPDHHVLVTSFAGGATDPEAARLSPAELAALVHGEIAPLLAVHGQPIFSHVEIYAQALPQYNLGHSERLTAIEHLRLELPSLWLAGNYLRGPSIGACVEQSQGVAQDVLARIRP
jgi:oxygen-dependent protoporphyrinogen oxidase